MQAGALEFLGGSQTHLVPWNTLPPVNAMAFHHLPTRQSLIIGSPLRPHAPTSSLSISLMLTLNFKQIVSETLDHNKDPGLSISDLPQNDELIYDKKWTLECAL